MARFSRLKFLFILVVLIVGVLSVFVPRAQVQADSFAISGLSFDHSAQTYSFSYSGYTGGNVTGESVAVFADGSTSWGYNHEPASCTGGSSGSGSCSGTFNYSHGTFSCSDAISVGIYGYNPSRTVTGLTDPDPSC